MLVCTENTEEISGSVQYIDFVIRFYVHSKAIRTDFFPDITQSRNNIISRENIVFSLISVSN